MPCADQMVRIEAILTGTPVDQCRSEQEKKREKREARERDHAETWRRIRESKNPHEEWQRTFRQPPEQSIRSVVRETILTVLAVVEEARQREAPMAEKPRQNGNVVYLNENSESRPTGNGHDDPLSPVA